MMFVNQEKCIGCGLCVEDCFVKDIELKEGKAEIANKRCFKCGHCIAICPVNAVATDEYNMEDVKEYDKENFQIEADRLLNFIKFRRTIRKFEGRDVEEEKILKIIEAGRFTETASNSQNVSYVVVREEKEKLREMTLKSLKKLGEYILENSDNKLYRAYAGLWIKMYDDFKIDPFGKDNLFFRAPAVIVVASESPINGGLASANMELMINALGLGAVFSGFLVKASENNQEMREFLGLKENQQIISCLVIGYPGIKYRRTAPRKAPDITWK